jgi:archaellin
MNHKNLTLALTAVVAAVAITAVAFAVPQQVMAGGHHTHHSSGGGIRVSQTVNHLNNCTDTTCLNDGNNTANIRR